MSSNIKKDQSFGIVPFYRDGNSYYVFMLKHLGGYWSFPKGHPEKGETPLETATRELKEESGLEVAEVFINCEALEENYTFTQKHEVIMKNVKYYLARVVDPKAILIDLGEVIDGKWVEVNEAPMHLTFEDAKRICRNVSQILQGRDK
jgi:bis(5'-nucleosidyl)-tetraphosphatase